MKSVGFYSIIALTIANVIASGQAPDGVPDNSLLKFIHSLNDLTRITAKAVPLQAVSDKACGPAVPPNQLRLGPHRQAVINVYVTQHGALAMEKPEATFPVGTVILKQKLADATLKEVVLYTGMLKREKGFNPDCGDWEFFTISGDGAAVTGRGRMESCMGCHKQYSETDFVTKRYSVSSRGPMLR